MTCLVVKAGRPIGTRAVTRTQCSEPQLSVTDSSATQSGRDRSTAAVADRPSMAARAPVAGGRARGGHGGDGQEALKEEKQDDEQDRDEAGELDVEGAALDAAQPVQQALR